MRDGLLIVDVQNDFCAGGALAVPDGDAVVPLINKAARIVAARGHVVLASRDWHPRTSRHFTANGGIWPIHCVAGTTGAQFHPGLDLPDDAVIVTKGDAPEEDGYSAFDGHAGRDRRGLAAILTAAGVNRVLVAGLATDYCVKHSVLDARRQGFEVVLLEDAVRGVNLEPADSAKAISEMLAAGAVLGTTTALFTDAGGGA
ncbi:MAG: bifunctional nicotinamidase/pyrazinamidase [Vicinamibacterales bacterium]